MKNHRNEARNHNFYVIINKFHSEMSFKKVISSSLHKINWSGLYDNFNVKQNKITFGGF